MEVRNTARQWELGQNNKGLPCPFASITCQEGYCEDCAIYETFLDCQDCQIYKEKEEVIND